MALARVQYTQAQAGNKNFTVPMPYISRDHIHVSVNGTDVSFSWLNDTTVQLTVTPDVDAVIDVRRETERENLLVDFQDASTITEEQLDLSAKQAFYIAQEAFDATGSSLVVANDGSYSASNRRITLIADPVDDQDAVTKAWVMNQYNSGIDANVAKTAAEAARDTALTYRNAAETFKIDAETARDVTLGYRNEAETFKDDAASSASSASSSATTATDALEEFQGQYWGAYASDPSVDSNGDSPDAGDLYYNTASKMLRVFDSTGSIWKDVASSVQGFYSREDYIATEGQTTFAIDYDVPFVKVFVNGAMLPTTDYEASSGTQVVLGTGVPAGTEVTLEGIAAFQLADTYTKAELETLVVPAGAIIPFAMGTAPSGWLVCNGAAVSRTTYSALFAAIGTTYGAGNGSTTFNLPDLRGEFIRGLDNGRGVDSGRTLGSTQSASNQAHTHTGSAISTNLGTKTTSSYSHSHTLSRSRPNWADAFASTWMNDINSIPYGFASSIGGVGTSYVTASNSVYSDTHSHSVSLGSHAHGLSIDSEGSEARPRNIALLYCIKY